MTQAHLLDLGVRPYREVWDLQHRLHAAVREGREPDTWIVVEHPPVITLGRQAKRENVLLNEDELALRGVDVVAIERGGDVTYHGPGQLVVYPIRKLERFREVVPLVRALESAVINLCAHFGVRGERWTEHAGVWVGRNQICAIGLAVQRMVSLHGLALNVSTSLDYDRLINPCGMSDRGITSLSAEAGRAVEMGQAKRALLDELARTFDVTFGDAARLSVA
ncbi:MAG TPA: lipoyl(octanoyl) transferase LipB [Candidatus Cybelea sp.]|jgi:lipoate-protein ligase B|nr:lipoyl(octanoyl) transferase LipB [Candidatus Cybelea sp.]